VLVTNTNATCSVLVVGAGPTGLALACGLLGRGVSVRVVDSAVGPATTSRALGLQPRGVEVLDRVGALGDLPALGIGVRQVVVHIGGREIGRLAVGAPTRLARQPGLLVSQAEIEGGLRHRLGQLGGAVEWGRELLGVDLAGTGIAAALDGGEIARAGWVVGCDGAHSVVRKAAGIGFPGVALVERFLLADVRAALPLVRDNVSVWLDGESMLAAFPLPGTDLWRLMAPAPDPGGATDPAAVLAQLTALLAQRSGIAPAAVEQALWTSTFRFHRRLADSYRAGRVLLAGDAAHIHSPFGGQGLNTGLGDAENLAWKLALVVSGHAAPALLDTYEAERRPIAEQVLASTSGMTRIMLGGSGAVRLVRDHVLVPLMNLPLAQRLISEQASQLRISYRRGPLGARSLRRPRPGDRMPDLACHRSDGTPTRLHAALRPSWGLLAEDPVIRERCADTAAQLLGTDNVARLAPAVGQSRRTALLVRPDAHLAWRGTDHTALRRWLTETLHGTSRIPDMAAR
jgi:4,5-epoxidase